jgi:hypothetical protein
MPNRRGKQDLREGDMKYKIGQKVKVIEPLWSGTQKRDAVGKIKSINNDGEYWIDFPDGSGGLVKTVEAIPRGRKPLPDEIKKKRELYKQWIKLGEQIFNPI